LISLLSRFSLLEHDLASVAGSLSRVANFENMNTTVTSALTATSTTQTKPTRRGASEFNWRRQSRVNHKVWKSVLSRSAPGRFEMFFATSRNFTICQQRPSESMRSQQRQKRRRKQTSLKWRRPDVR